MTKDTKRSGDGGGSGAARTAGFSIGGAVIAFLFVWIVFDNFALAFFFAIVGGVIGAGAGRRGKGGEIEAGTDGGGDGGD
ncbi:MAG: hypothetical protein ABL308_10910 [Oceanicaulis sp.]